MLTAPLTRLTYITPSSAVTTFSFLLANCFFNFISNDGAALFFIIGRLKFSDDSVTAQRRGLALAVTANLRLTSDAVRKQEVGIHELLNDNISI